MEFDMNNLHKMMIEEVCKFFKCSYTDIFSRIRQKNVVCAKKVIYWVLRREGLTYNQISRLVKKDHETIIMGVRTLPDEFKSFALLLFNKYKKYGLREAQDQEEESFKVRMNIIINLLNNGYSEHQISQKLGESCELVADDIAKHTIKKLIPDYKNYNYKKIYTFLQKNKNNY